MSARGVAMSIGSSATSTRPSGDTQTTDGCLTRGASAITSIFQPAGGVGSAALAALTNIRNEIAARKWRIKKPGPAGPGEYARMKPLIRKPKPDDGQHRLDP